MWQVIIILLCLGINALLAGSELAFVSISRAYLRKLSSEGDQRADSVLKLRENPERMLSVIQIGITFVGVIAAAVGGVGFDEWLAPIFMKTFGLSQSVSGMIAIFLFVVPYTFLSVVIGELIPKSLAFHNPKWVIFRTSRWLIILDKIFFPIVFLLEKSTKLAVKIFFPSVKKEDQEEGIIVGRIVRPYAINLAKIESKRVVDAMVPWDQTDKIDQNADLEEVKKRIHETKHTRIPVIKNEMPVGLLYTKEFLSLLEREEIDWHSVLTPLIKVSERDPLIRAFKRMQENRSHMSIVYRDQTPIGMVTIEDIIEEIFGEIYDESD